MSAQIVASLRASPFYLCHKAADQIESLQKEIDGQNAWIAAAFTACPNLDELIAEIDK